ncbi:hypothetical protein CRG98_040485 [Punica granatum]|uniref:G-patch domain-containing protein n=1 Tax=Punica granatum TaxID=22663 RepID=A0A2I0I536_PUNGR|nr:hypothetical protein CRG98_040485 [Punica granatum]
MEDPTNKGEESSKKVPATSSSSGRRGKEVSVNIVNTAQQAPQQYSMNYTAAPPVAPSYAPHAPQYRPQPPTQPIYYSALPPPPLPTLREKIQEMMDAKELVFNAVRSPNVQANPLPDHGPAQGPSINMITVCKSSEGEGEQGWPSPFVIKYVPAGAAVGFAGIDAPHAPLVIDNSATTDKGKAPATEVETRPRTQPTPSKKVIEEEAEASMKIIKASEYKVVEQMAKSPAYISLLALLLNSEPHREALMRVLTAAQVPKGTPSDRIDETINSIFSNTISLSDDELPSEGCAHSRALHIMNVDLNRIRPSKTAVRAFDGSRREERIITVKGEEDYAIYKETAVPYISVGDDKNLPFYSFETISVIRDYGEVGPSRADRMIGKVLLRHNYSRGTGLGPRGQGINRPIEVEVYKHRRGLGFRPSCHEIIEARRGNHLHRLATHYGRLNRGIPVPPLSHFFPEPPLIIGSTSDGPSSDFDDTTDALPTVYAVTEEIPSGVHIPPAQENEELNNWTSVLRYSAVIADVLHSNPNHRRVDSNPSEDCLGEPGPIYLGEGLDEDSLVPEIEESLRRLEDHQLTSLEPTEEINVGVRTRI